MRPTAATVVVRRPMSASRSPAVERFCFAPTMRAPTKTNSVRSPVRDRTLGQHPHRPDHISRIRRTRKGARPNWPGPFSRLRLRPCLPAHLRNRPAIGSSRISVQVVPQYLRARRVAQFTHGLGFDLANTLPRHAVNLPDLVKRFGLTVGQTEPHRYDAGLAFGQRTEHRVQLLLQYSK